MSPQPAAFERLIDSWFPLTYVLNNLNRGLGLADAYPFVLSPSAVAKLRFVDDVVGRAKVGGTCNTGGVQRIKEIRTVFASVLIVVSSVKAVFQRRDAGTPRPELGIFRDFPASRRLGVDTRKRKTALA